MGAAPVEDFIARWGDSEGGQERANYALFLAELCDVLEVPRPAPAVATAGLNDYVFERAVKEPNGDGTVSHRRIDLYRRGCFVLEAKQSRKRDEIAKELPDLLDPVKTRGRRGAERSWDTLIVDAKAQAVNYARCAYRRSTAGRPSSSSATSVTSSRSSPTSPARARTTRSSPTARASASISTISASPTSATACGRSGPIPRASIRPGKRRASPATSPNASPPCQRRWRRPVSAPMTSPCS